MTRNVDSAVCGVASVAGLDETAFQLLVDRVVLGDAAGFEKAERLADAGLESQCVCLTQHLFAARLVLGLRRSVVITGVGAVGQHVAHVQLVLDQVDGFDRFLDIVPAAADLTVHLNVFRCRGESFPLTRCLYVVFVVTLRPAFVVAPPYSILRHS